MVAKAIRQAEHTPTVLLIDDFHMVPPHLQAYFYGLLLERRLGNYKLSNNIAIILTMNNSDKAGFNGINSAVRNRMSILEIEFDFDYWFENFGNRLHYLVASFLKTKPNFCQEDETTGITGYATARAWTAIANELHFYDKEFIIANARTIAGMQVSKEAASAFHSHVTYVAALDFEETVSKRQLINLAHKDPNDSIIYSYITNFIETVKDGEYLFDLMEENASNEASAFIGFTLGELNVKFADFAGPDKIPMSDGLLYVCDRLLGMKADINKYSAKVDSKVLDKAFEKDIPSLQHFRSSMSEYLLN